MRIISNVLVVMIVLCCTWIAARATTADSIFTYTSKLNDTLKPIPHGKALLHQYNPTTQLGSYYAHRGNYGLPIQSLICKAPTSVLTTFAPATMSAYLYTTDSASYYDTKRPYTDIQWINGLKKEQYIRVIHTQNITPRWNVAVDFNRYRNKGYMLRQLANNAHFTATTAFCNKRNNYTLNAAYSLNRINLHENGGVNDTVFLNIGFIDKNSIAPLLPLALRNYKSNSFLLDERYYFVSTKKDTSHKKLVPQQPYGLYLAMQNKYSVNRNQYIDNAPNTAVNTTYNYSALFTNDSNSVRMHNHLLLLGYKSKLQQPTPQHWRYEASAGLGIQQGIINYYNRRGTVAKNQLFILKRNTFTNTYTQWQAQATNHKWNIAYNGQYVLAGYNSANVLNSGTAHYNLTTVHTLYANVSNSMRTTDYFNTEYYSNNFMWKNNFGATTSTQLNVGYTNAKFLFGVYAFSNIIKNHVYFDSSAQVVQSPTTIVNNGIVATWHARFKKLNWQSNITLQTNTAPLLLVTPTVLTRQLLYLQGSLFKRALPLQIGLDGSYMSSYMGFGYMPTTMQFYTSNSVINAYPFVDFFVNANIGQARIFFKVEHFLSGVLGNNYFVAKNSPAHDRAIKLGIYWYMYN